MSLSGVKMFNNKKNNNRIDIKFSEIDYSDPKWFEKGLREVIEAQDRIGDEIEKFKKKNGKKWFCIG